MNNKTILTKIHNPEINRTYKRTANGIYYPTANSYFSGAGGLDLGLTQAGIKIIQSLDVDKKATNCMKANAQYFGHTILCEDIRQKTVLDQPDSDIMAFTYPCTKYSTIADIHGVRTGDELFKDAFRHMALRKPEMFIVENVPGMKKFKVVMEAMSKLPGYYVYILCPLDASIWLPQRRERLIMIGTRKPFDLQAPRIALKRPRIKDIIERNPEINLTKCVINRIKGKYRDLPIVVDPNDADAIAPTCVAHYAKDLGTRLVKDKRSRYGLRPFTQLEYARLQGFPDDFEFPNDLSAYTLIGNAVAVPMGYWIGQAAIKYFNKNKQARVISTNQKQLSTTYRKAA
jgi:DNA (cytosine-5)-methyltransferase 1